MRKVTRGPIPWLLILLTAAPPWAFAQAPGAQAAFNQGEIEQLLAPIALYPDELLSQILMASTYPLEVIQADRWVKQHIDLKGNALTTALEKEGWDPSVKSLVNFPQVLAIMNEKLDWMQKLGDAFLAQQKEVMDTIQRLRAKAQVEGNLKTTKAQKTIVEQQVIKIEPVSPQVIYGAHLQPDGGIRCLALPRVSTLLLSSPGTWRQRRPSPLLPVWLSGQPGAMPGADVTGAGAK